MLNLFLSITHHKESRQENPQKLTQLSPRSHPRHVVGKRTAQKDAIKDNTSDSQLLTYGTYKVHVPAALTQNITLASPLVYSLATLVQQVRNLLRQLAGPDPKVTSGQFLQSAQNFAVERPYSISSKTFFRTSAKYSSVFVK